MTVERVKEPARPARTRVSAPHRSSRFQPPEPNELTSGRPYSGKTPIYIPRRFTECRIRFTEVPWDSSPDGAARNCQARLAVNQGQTYVCAIGRMEKVIASRAPRRASRQLGVDQRPELRIQGSGRILWPENQTTGRVAAVPRLLCQYRSSISADVGPWGFYWVTSLAHRNFE
jgi:hypothetical protein